MNSSQFELTARIPVEAAGRRLDQALAQLFPDYSRSRLTAWIRSGDVLVDGAVVPPRHIVDGGETVTVRAQATQEVPLAPEIIALDIRYDTTSDGIAIVVDWVHCDVGRCSVCRRKLKIPASLGS